MQIFVYTLLFAAVFHRLVKGKDIYKNFADDDDYPIVETSNGPVKGLKFVSSWTNKAIYSFRGIPYAAPPVGDLRFMPPVMPNNWSSVMDCTADKVTCPQPYQAELTEDCLFINVYSPNVAEVKKLAPVIVWVHGGAFYMGSSMYSEYGPDFLVAENVVVISFNYRLGALGFLSLGTEGFPGNAGLRDQLLALQWVQANVHRFGGDPRQVTLFGESAGAASVHLQYISPLPVGTFQRVIGDSGAGVAGWAVREDVRPYALQLATLLNCTEKGLETCLRAADVKSIIDAQNRMQATPKDTLLGCQLEFVPTIDKDWSENPFLPYDPKTLSEKGIGSKVDFIMGINSKEGMIKVWTTGTDVVKDIRNQLEEFIPDKVRNTSSKEKIKQFASEIRAHYFKNPVPSLENDLNGYIDLYTDYLFGVPTAISARSFKSRNKIYLYYFSFEGSFQENVAKEFRKNYNVTGVAHGEELLYIFTRGSVNQTASNSSNEMKTLRRMVRMWTNFAIHGAPTVGPDPLLQNVMWSPVGDSSSRFLWIDRDLTMSSKDFLTESVALWDTVSASQTHRGEKFAVVVISVATAVWLW